jgi:hypothetical protein
MRAASDWCSRRRPTSRSSTGNRHYLVGHAQTGGEIWKGLGEAWLSHRNRCTYERLAMIPAGETPPGTFNLWRGFGVAPQPGDWPLIRQHLLDVVCSGNHQHFDWLLRWFAYWCRTRESRPKSPLCCGGSRVPAKDQSVRS